MDDFEENVSRDKEIFRHKYILNDQFFKVQRESFFLVLITVIFPSCSDYRDGKRPKRISANRRQQ